MKPILQWFSGMESLWLIFFPGQQSGLNRRQRAVLEKEQPFAVNPLLLAN
jgi:hypothetical protein